MLLRQSILRPDRVAEQLSAFIAAHSPTLAVVPQQPAAQAPVQLVPPSFDRAAAVAHMERMSILLKYPTEQDVIPDEEGMAANRRYFDSHPRLEYLAFLATVKDAASQQSGLLADHKKQLKALLYKYQLLKGDLAQHRLNHRKSLEQMCLEAAGVGTWKRPS